MNRILYLVLVIFPSLSFGQVGFEERVNTYSYDYLGVDVLYDDFDNDGDLDIIKNGDKHLGKTLFHENKNGSFTETKPILISTKINPIISFDLNNDGFPDLLTYHSYNTIGVLYNMQNGTFSDEESILNFEGSNFVHPIKFDYNNDGYLDLILTDNSNNAYLFINNKNSGFEPAQFLLNIGYSVERIYHISDFDSDGDFDIYVKSHHGMRIYINNNGSFTYDYPLVVSSNFDSYGVADFDGNGFEDILYWRNDSFWVKYFDFDDVKGEYVLLEDKKVIDNIPYYSYYSSNDALIFMDKEPENNYAVYIAMENTKGKNNIYKTEVKNNIFNVPEIVLSDFQINVFNLYKYRFLDINNNGNIDFAYVSDFNGANMILINFDIDGQSDKATCIQQEINPKNFIEIDMNGDGTKDLATGSVNGLGYFQNITDSEFPNIQNLIDVMADSNASKFTLNYIMDFNNDGIGDVVDFQNNRDEAKVYKNLGNDNFEFLQSVTLPNYVNSKMFFADIDGDNFTDLVFLVSKGIFWAKNNSGINFEPIQPLKLNNYNNFHGNILSFADFNEDNRDDVLVLNVYYQGNQTIKEVVLFESSNGELDGKIVGTVNGDFSRSHIKIHDYNQDGYLDFFIYSINGNEPFYFFINNGDNSFKPITIDNISIEDIEFADFDGDGYEEIYAWNHYAYINNIFYYKTDNYTEFARVEIDSFKAYLDDSDPQTRGDLHLYDYDNDNKKDLFICNYSHFKGLISVYKNISETLVLEEVENNTIDNLKLYPNPFTNSIYWDNPNNEIFKIKLFSLNGQLIFERKTSNNNIDFSTLNSGIYLLTLEGKNSIKKQTYRVIKK